MTRDPDHPRASGHDHDDVVSAMTETRVRRDGEPEVVPGPGQRFARSHAVVIGIDAYGGNVPPLVNAARDALRVGRALGVDHGFAVRGLLNAAATSTTVRRDFPAPGRPARPRTTHLRARPDLEGGVGRRRTLGLEVAEERPAPSVEPVISFELHPLQRAHTTLVYVRVYLARLGITQ